MKVRRIISQKKLKEYFHIEWNYTGWENLLHWNRQLFNNVVFFISLILLSIVLGLFWKHFLAVAGALVFLLVFLYLKTQKLAGGISIKRTVPAQAREKETLTVIYTIANETAFPLSGIYFKEFFDGLQEGYFLVSINRTIPAHTQFQHQEKLTLSGGMGVKSFEPFSITIQDELKVFSCRCDFPQRSEIQVFPLIEKSPQLRASISPDTIHYGFYEVSKRGDSNLFIGTRDYRSGDPVKHINWKLSSKAHKIILNEYEKNTNSFITLLIDLDLDTQSGKGEVSTWEAAKDLALSIMANEIKKNNQIQVVSNELFIPFDTGERQLNTLERHFTKHELKTSGSAKYLQHLSNLPPESQIYYICPRVTAPRVLETFDLLMRLKTLGHEIVVLTLDPYQHLYDVVRDKQKMAIRLTKDHIQNEFSNFEKKLGNLGIRLINIEVKPALNLFHEISLQAAGILEK